MCHKYGSTPWPIRTWRRWCDACGHHMLPELKERFHIQREKEFTNENSLNCLYLGSFQDDIWNLSRWRWMIEVYSCNPGTFRWNLRFTKTDELRDDSLHMKRIHLSRRSSTRPILCCSSWIGRRRKGTKRTANNFLHSSWSCQQRCQRSRVNYRFKQGKKIALSNSLETWTWCSVLGPLAFSTRCWFGILAERF